MNHVKIKILVDADACPVKEEIAGAARRFDIEAWFVASYAHRIPPMDGAKVMQVDDSSQSADLFIANHLSKGDILVTQDYGLAAIGLGKKAVVLSNRGQQYEEETIDFMLAQRHEAAKQRRNGRYGKGPRPFTNVDRDKFLQCLTKVLRSMQENGVL
ncbi:YaiI/YqxD family protein [Paenibacillus turpanensis]|uniref:YaiI/YqxD family protein n=1 Tax=Paenibacillus turpanensis TaxID=2689078 RepID=UPI001407A0BF|nr:YaiI/YqxD family protein [Paenibacillus turpanensis]